MRVPLSWLKEYVDFDADARTLAHDLTMSGTKIEGIEEPRASFEGVFIGKVLEAGPHPNADKLRVCRVDVAGEELEIVCGAANVRAGLTVAVARVGARLPGGLKIRKSKIRGVASQGMICSARELELGADADGILELEDGLTSGAPFTGTGGDTTLEAEITPNRPDCLSMLGIAREVAALYGSPLRLPAIWSGHPAGDTPVNVAIESAEDCARYLGRTIRNLRVGPSPDWLRERLTAMGLEPINNVVDVTNFVLFETGQPIHAFDLKRLRGGRIVVRRARAGETLRTLDDVERKLDPDILVIADAESPVALAGIMGGADSAVSEDTTDVLLEVAYFRPDLVRSGRRKLGLDTDASYRFERETDVEAVRWVADRATQLFIDVCGGEVREDADDAYPRPWHAREIVLRAARANQLIGTELSAQDMARLLGRLGLEARPEAKSVSATGADGRIHVRVPAFRRDLHEEIDLVEEVARVHGYENIPDDVLPPAPLVSKRDPRETLLERLRSRCVGLGYFEARTSAFMDRSDPDRMRLGEDDPRRSFVRVRNPIVAALDTMRTSLVPGMLRVLRHNVHHGSDDLRLVQIDRVFIAQADREDGLPREPEKLLALACGARHPAGWAEAHKPCDLYDIKGDAEALLEQLGVDSVWSAGYTEPFLNSAASFLISGSYGTIGGGGAVDAEVLRAYDIDVPVFLLELDVDQLAQHLPANRTYRGIARFPAVKRDLSLVVPRRVQYRDVQAAVVESGGALLESVECFDVFEDPSLGPNAHSIGLRLRFRSGEKTLQDKDVDPTVERMVRRLAKQYEVKLRAE